MNDDKNSQPADVQSDNPDVPPNHDDTDVAAALARETQDGKGDDPVPPADFDSFATQGVEKKKLLSVEDVADQVLRGHWGSSQAIASQRLSDAGYDVDAVTREYARRKSGGAPSAF